MTALKIRSDVPMFFFIFVLTKAPSGRDFSDGAPEVRSFQAALGLE